MSPDEQIEIAYKIPEWDEIFRIMPLAFVVIIVIGVGAFMAWFFMSKHINSLKDIIDFLKIKYKD